MEKTETSEHECLCDDCGVTFVARRNPSPRAGETKRLCSLCRANLRAARQTTTAQVSGDRNEYRSPMPCELPAAQPHRKPHPSTPRTASHTAKTRGKASTGARSRRELFAKVCDRCGATAYVPFEPTRFQPVLCRGCYNEKKHAQTSQRKDDSC